MTIDEIRAWAGHRGPSAAIAGDAVSSMLAGLRIGAWVMGPRSLAPPFGVRFPSDTSGLMLITHGEAVVPACDRSSSGDAWRRAERGDLVIWLPGAAMSVRDRAETPAVPIERLVTRASVRSRSPIRIGAGHPSFAFVGAALRFDAGGRGPIAPTLPRVLVMPVERSVRLRDTAVLLESHAADDSPGAGAFLAGIAQTLAAQAIAVAVEDRGIEAHDATADPAIGRVLGMVRADPASAWTASRLAAEAGVSRTVLFDTFRALVGESPAKYVRRVRLEHAAALLRETNHDVGTIARRVGYTSEGAFSAAFRAWSGRTPTQHRDAHAETPGLRPGETSVAAPHPAVRPSG